MVKKTLALMLFVIVLGGGCLQGGSGAPQELAVFPQGSGYPQKGAAPGGYGAPPEVVYHTRLDLLVWNLDRTAMLAGEIVAELGGYRSGYLTWTGDGETGVTLEFALPSSGHEPARTRLRALGAVEFEESLGYLAGTQGGGYPAWSTISLTLTPRFGSLTPDLWPGAGSRAARTFDKAAAVSAGIFSLLLDLAIWLVVVAGPFVVIGLGIRWVWRRVRPSGEQTVES